MKEGKFDVRLATSVFVQFLVLESIIYLPHLISFLKINLFLRQGGARSLSVGECIRKKNSDIAASELVLWITERNVDSMYPVQNVSLSESVCIGGVGGGYLDRVDPCKHCIDN